MELLTLAQSSPGPIAINTSVFIGYKTRGVAGSGRRRMRRQKLPSFICILVIAIFFSPRCATTSSSTLPSGMRPAVVALIVVPTIALARRDASGADRRGGRHGAGRLVVPDSRRSG